MTGKKAGLQQTTTQLVAQLTTKHGVPASLVCNEQMLLADSLGKLSLWWSVMAYDGTQELWSGSRERGDEGDLPSAVGPVEKTTTSRLLRIGFLCKCRHNKISGQQGQVGQMLNDGASEPEDKFGYSEHFFSKRKEKFLHT
eukprot:1159416-Pelagomonas_calceolata.AAC.3